MSTTNLPPQAQQLLEQLHPIATPEPAGWWPLAPGWWLIIALSLAVAAAIIYAAVNKSRRKRYRKEALALLTQLAQQRQPSIADINAVLKRTALYAYPRERNDIARSYGQAWVAWLNSHCKQPIFEGAPAQLLSEHAYRDTPKQSLQPLLDAAAAWVEQHSAAANEQRKPHA